MTGSLFKAFINRSLCVIQNNSPFSFLRTGSTIKKASPNPFAVYRKACFLSIGDIRKYHRLFRGNSTGFYLMPNAISHYGYHGYCLLFAEMSFRLDFKQRLGTGLCYCYRGSPRGLRKCNLLLIPNDRINVNHHFPFQY